MSELPGAARDLRAGMHITDTHPDHGEHVYRVLHTYEYTSLSGVDRTAATLLRLSDGQVWMETYRVDEHVRLASPEQVADAEADGQRTRLATALEQLVRDIRQQRLTLPEIGGRMVALLPEGLTYDRTDGPAEQAARTCEAGTACTGRDGRPSPHACPVCGHCSIHDRDAGCAARTDTGRCGCTDGGAS